MNNKIILLYIYLVLTFSYACQLSSNKQINATDVSSNKQINLDVENNYKIFLTSLTITEYTSVGKAAQKLTELSKDIAATKFDKLYTDFLAYRDTAIVKMQLKELEHPDFSPTSQQPAHQKLIADLKNNHLAVDYSEGMAFLIPDLFADTQKWGEQMTPVMLSYITQSSKELGEGYYLDDGALMISVADVLQRALWWEKFNTQNSQFVFAKSAKNKEIDYVLTAMVGANNTPAFDYETHQLKPEYKKAYELFVQTFGDSNTAKSIKTYYDVLQKTAFKESSESQKIFKNMINYLQQ